MLEVFLLRPGKELLSKVYCVEVVVARFDILEIGDWN